MEEDDFEISLKIIAVGNGGVGKTSMLTRYAKGCFTGEYKKTIDETDQEVIMMLWDTAGQEEFDALTSRYYKGASAAILVFSTTNRESFDQIKKWKSKVEAECGSIPMVLVQNKTDLLAQATMTAEEAESLASELHLKLYRASVKENFNIDEIMKYVALRAIKGDVPKNENTVFNAQQIKDIHPDQAPELRQPVKPVNSPVQAKSQETEIETIIEDVEEDMNNVPDEPPVDNATSQSNKKNKTFKITQDPSKEKKKKKHKWCNLL